MYLINNIKKIGFRSFGRAAFLTAMLVPMFLKAQSPPAVYRTALVLNDPYISRCDTLSETDSVCNLCHQSLSGEYFERNFTRTFFKAFKKGKIKVFRRADLTEPVSYETVKDEIYYLKYFLKRNFEKKRPPAGAEELPEYEIYLISLENWNSESAGKLTRQSTGIGGIHIIDLRKPLLPAAELYFDLKNPEIPLELLGLRSDYSGNPDASIREEILNCRTNFKLLFTEPALPADWEKRLSGSDSLATGTRRVNYRILVPPNLSPTSSDEKPVTDEQLTNNNALFRQAVPTLFRLILREKLPLYAVYEVDRKVKMKSLADVYTAINSHPLTPEKVSRKNAKRFDFSYGVQDLEVGGYLVRNGEGKVSFQVEYVGIVWGKNWDDPEKSIVVRVPAEKLKKIQVNNRPLNEFIAQEAIYYTLMRVNNIYPLNLTEANYYDRLLRSGEWEAMPHQLKYLQLSEPARRELNRKAGLVR